MSTALLPDQPLPGWLGGMRFNFEVCDYAVAEQQIKYEERIELKMGWWCFGGDPVVVRSESAPYRGPHWLF